jgi:hypothetical protein
MARTGNVTVRAAILAATLGASVRLRRAERDTLLVELHFHNGLLHKAGRSES